MLGQSVHSYQDLIVWQKAMDLVVDIYKLTNILPNNERYVLSAQMKRSSVSIPSNIAEGRRRGTRKDYRQFLIIAYGSGAELETQIEIAHRLRFVNEDDYKRSGVLLSEIMKMLNAMITKLGNQ